MKKRNLKNAVPMCINCNIIMKHTIIKLGEVKADAWRCPKCKEEIIHPDVAQRALLESKLRKGVKVKVGQLNKAPYVRFPKEFEAVVKKGDEVFVFLEGKDEIKLKVKHAQSG